MPTSRSSPRRLPRFLTGPFHSPSRHAVHSGQSQRHSRSGSPIRSTRRSSPARPAALDSQVAQTPPAPSSLPPPFRVPPHRVYKETEDLVRLGEKAPLLDSDVVEALLAAYRADPNFMVGTHQKLSMEAHCAKVSAAAAIDAVAQQSSNDKSPHAQEETRVKRDALDRAIEAYNEVLKNHRLEMQTQGRPAPSA
jgi:hypothetical protein